MSESNPESSPVDETEPSSDSGTNTPAATKAGDLANPNSPATSDRRNSSSERVASSQDPALSPRDRFEQGIADQRNALDDHEPEETLWSGGYSPKAMVGSWIILMVVSIALLVAAVMFSQLGFGIAFAIIGVLWVLVAANYARMRLGFHYELTSQRFIHKAGILTRRTDRIEVIDIDDVSYQQGPIQRMFGVGCINITSSDRSDPFLHLIGIDKVGEVAGLIDDVRRAERRRRSLHIEAI